MCWSASVSLQFAVFDTVIVVLLLWLVATGKQPQRQQQQQVVCTCTYAALMTCVAVQEWAQFAIWQRQHLTTTAGDACQDAMDVLLSFTTVAAAEALPLSLIVSAYCNMNGPAHDANHTATTTIALKRSWICATAAWLWLVEVTIVLAAVYATQKYCVQLGPHSHQVWVCESAVYQVGGRRLQHWVYFSYVLAAVLAVQANHAIPKAEKRLLQVFGLMSSIVAVTLYGNTLEACSIWCWSAFVLGMGLTLVSYARA